MCIFVVTQYSMNLKTNRLHRFPNQDININFNTIVYSRVLILCSCIL